MVILRGEVICSCVGPHIVQSRAVGQLSHRLGVVLRLLAHFCQGAIETAGIVPAQANGTLRTERQTLDRLPVESQSISIGIGVAQLLVDGNVVLRVGIGEELLLVGVGVGGIDISVLTQTVRWAVLQYVDDTARTHVLTTGTCVAAERELRVELHRQLVSNLHVGLHIEVRAAYTRAQNDTLVLALCQRDVELHLLRTTPNIHVGRVVQRRLAHHLVLPVVRRQRAVHVEVVGVAEVRAEELTVRRACAVAGVPLILVNSKLLGIHQVELLRYVADVQVAIEAHLHVACLGALRGYHHNAVTTLRTIDGSEGGILQNIDGRNVRRRNVVDVIHLEAINDVERLVRLGD